jgi:hypothetical protein
MANIIVPRNTGHAITEERLVRRVDADISRVEPRTGPLLTFLNEAKQREAVDSTRVEWFESDYVARWAQNSAAAVGAATASTTVTVTDGTLFVIGEQFCVPTAVASSAAPEICRITGKTGDVLTVVRNVGGSGVAAIEANGAIRILGSAHEEYGSVPSMKTAAPVKKITYLGIEKTACDMSITAAASKAYGAPQGDRDREHKDKLVEHKQKMNATLLWGQQYENLTGGATGYPIRGQQGLRNVISTNTLDGGGILTPKKLMQFSRMCFRYGAEEKILLASPIVVEAIQAWASAKLMITSSEKKFGLNIQTVQTPHGVWRMVRDWMLEDGVSGKNGFGGMALSVDLDQIWYVFLNNNGINRDTAMYPDVLKDGADGYKDEILTEYGYKIKQEKFHGLLYDVTDYMA